MYLSVIIPAYNEEKRIAKTLENIDKYLSKQEYDYEIIVASDGSKDKTAEVVKSLIPRIKNLNLIDNKENNGKGYVVRQGLLSAKGDFRLFTDADNSTSIDQIEKIWPEVKNGYDIIIGSRDIKGAVLDPPQPWIRNIILGEGFKLFRKIVIGLWRTEDTQCGFKFLTKKAAENILPKCKIDRFAFDPEILVVGRKMGYKIKEVPVLWKNDLDSKVKIGSMVKMALDLFVIRKNLIIRAYK
ncbi:MAG: glycosyltransferase family 2 protein [Candidatus Nealsonbacteria bacterium]|nr:glycosyltransferase family 2 protein [Candidatus Nealsonbacteria bacterium]